MGKGRQQQRDAASALRVVVIQILSVMHCTQNLGQYEVPFCGAKAAAVIRGATGGNQLAAKVRVRSAVAGGWIVCEPCRLARALGARTKPRGA